MRSIEKFLREQYKASKSVKLQKSKRSRGKYQDQDSGFEKLTEMSADLLILEYLNISTPFPWDFYCNQSFNDIYITLGTKKFTLLLCFFPNDFIVLFFQT